MTEYSRLAKGFFTSTGSAQVINLPFKPDYIELINYTAAAAAAMTGDVVPFAWWDVNMGQGFAVVERSTGGGSALISDVITSSGFSTFSAGLSLQYGATQQVVTITKASPAIVTVTGHGYKSGDVVVFQGLNQTSSTGMQQIAGIAFTITVSDANTFSIPWNTNQSNYTGISGSPTGALVKKVLYPTLYAPGVSVITAITTGTTTTIDTVAAHNLVVGQEVAFRIPAAWGTTQLNSLPNITSPGSPIYGYVVSVTDYNTVVVNINSTGFTAYNSNQAFASFPGLQFPQMIAVGDVNTGGVQISSGSALYPPPYVVAIGTTQVNTINGPAILGSFINNTSRGFIIGSGTAVGDPNAHLVGANADVIYWRAAFHDLSVPS